MRKLLALLMVLCMLFSVATVFAGCEDGGKKKSSSSKNDDDEDEDEDDEEENDDENKDDENKDDENKDEGNGDDEGNGEETPNDTEPEATEPTAPAATEDPKNQYQDADAFDRLESDYEKHLNIKYGLDATYIEDLTADFIVNAGTMNHYSLDSIIEAMQDPDVMEYYLENEFYYDDYLGSNIHADITEFSYFEVDEETADAILAAIIEDYDYYGFDASDADALVGIDCDYILSGDDDSWNEESYSIYALLYNNEWLFFTYNAGTWEDGEEYSYAYFELDYFLFDFYYIMKDM